MKTNLLIISTLLFFLSNTSAQTQKSANDIKIVGAMKNVMWKGQLYGNIHLDTIANKKHLYGIGPVEYLAGELMIFEGKSYKSTVLLPSTMKVEETFDVKAPFFGYANIEKWKEIRLPDSVQTIPQLENYLDQITKTTKRPFMFKLSGVVEIAKIHVVNLPKGAKVSSPDEAHKGQVNFTLTQQASHIIGFFSTEHKSIFTHHDTFLHMHLLTADKTKMGHLDEMILQKGTVILYLPAE